MTEGLRLATAPIQGALLGAAGLLHALTSATLYARVAERPELGAALAPAWRPAFDAVAVAVGLALAWGATVLGIHALRPRRR